MSRVPSFLPTPDQLVQSHLTGYRDILFNPDVAFRENRQLQRKMRLDPDVANPLELRLAAVCLLDQRVIPEDPENPEHVAECDATLKALQGMKRWLWLLYNLDEAIWYGNSAASLVYADLQDDDRVRGSGKVYAGGRERKAEAVIRYAPVRWVPLHPDSILFDKYGNPLLKINPVRWTGPAELREATPEGAFAVRLTPEQESCFVSHVARIGAGDYEEPYETATPYKGRGLRSDLWFIWFMKQSFMAQMLNFAERLGSGNFVGRYPFGNDQARKAMIEALQAIVREVAVAMPQFPTADGKDVYGIDVLEPKGTGWQVFPQLWDAFSERIQKRIIGQEAVMNGVASGLNTNTAETHAETFHKILTLDAKTLAESITEGIVRPLCRANFVGRRRHRFEFAVDDVDPREFMEAVSKFIDAGGEVGKRAVRERLGLPEPDPNDPDDVLGGAGLGGFDPIGGIFDRAREAATDEGRRGAEGARAALVPSGSDRRRLTERDDDVD